MPCPDSTYEPPKGGTDSRARFHRACSRWCVPDWSPRETNTTGRSARRRNAATASLMPADPAGLRGMSDAVAAFRRLAERPVVFVSRCDQSGTHQREQALWKRARLSVPPFGGSYVESGQGMGATLQLADEKHGYTLTDRATYLAWRDKLQLVPLVEGDPLLYNVYHVLELNPKNAPCINVAGGRAFAEFLVSS